MDLRKAPALIFSCKHGKFSRVLFCYFVAKKSKIAMESMQNRCDEWWPMFRILLLSKPNVRAKCEYTSPICCVPQRGNAARNAIRISLGLYAATLPSSNVQSKS